MVFGRVAVSVGEVVEVVYMCWALAGRYCC